LLQVYRQYLLKAQIKDNNVKTEEEKVKEELPAELLYR